MIKVGTILLLIGLSPQVRGQSAKEAMDLDGLWRAGLLRLSSAESLANLNEEFLKLSQWQWRCEKEIKEQDFPFSCLSFSSALHRSKNFAQLATPALNGRVEKACIVALHHQLGHDLKEIEESLHQLPPSSQCRSQGLAHIRRVAYRRESRY